MKKMELSLLENIGDNACRLINTHPSLLFFAHDYPIEDLVQATSIGQSESTEPVRPPTKFISEVKRVVSEKAWMELTTLLEKWNNLSEVENRLSVKEHEYLMMGLLWQTLLITECKRWHDAIQKEVAAIGT